MKKTIVIYHADCPDGFGSAWAFWKRYGDAAEYTPAKHGSKPPCVKGRNVFIADFSYDRETLLLMERESESITVLDHHITAKKDLEGLDFCHFDMGHSGAYLSWAYNFGEDNVAPLILYVEDRDLWKWELPFSESILSAVDSYRRDFKVWDKINDMLLANPDRFKEEGDVILRYKNILIEKLVRNSHEINILGDKVPAINASFFQSELGALLAQNSKYSAVYYYNGGGYTFSLRSDANGADVSEVAKALGGGGHKRASGFSVSSFDDLNN